MTLKGADMMTLLVGIIVEGKKLPKIATQNHY
jgi:hypothetical protein